MATNRDRKPFLDAIKDRPHDVGPKAAYADFLQDFGDSTGECISKLLKYETIRREDPTALPTAFSRHVPDNLQDYTAQQLLDAIELVFPAFGTSDGFAQARDSLYPGTPRIDQLDYGLFEAIDNSWQRGELHAPTEPYNPQAVERHVQALYRRARLARPTIFHVPSPIHGLYAAHALIKGDVLWLYRKKQHSVTADFDGHLRTKIETMVHALSTYKRENIYNTLVGHPMDLLYSTIVRQVLSVPALGYSYVPASVLESVQTLKLLAVNNQQRVKRLELPMRVDGTYLRDYEPIQRVSFYRFCFYWQLISLMERPKPAYYDPIYPPSPVTPPRHFIGCYDWARLAVYSRYALLGFPAARTRLHHMYRLAGHVSSCWFLRSVAIIAPRPTRVTTLNNSITEAAWDGFTWRLT